MRKGSYGSRLIIYPSRTKTNRKNQENNTTLLIDEDLLQRFFGSAIAENWEYIWIVLLIIGGVIFLLNGGGGNNNFRPTNR